MKCLAYDTETTGLNRFRGARMIAFSVCSWNGRSVAFQLEGDRPPAEIYQARNALEKIWSDDWRGVAKIMHNARFDIAMTSAYLGKDLEGHEIHETMALSHLFNNLHNTHSLKDLGRELFDYPSEIDDAVAKYMSGPKGILACPPHILSQYQRQDAERTMLLFRLFYPKLREYGLHDEYEVERKLVWTTLAIENRGIMLDVPRCKKMIEDLEKKACQAQEELCDLIGDRKKPTDAILRHVIYHRLRMPVLAYTKSGQPALDSDTLQELEKITKHPILDVIQKYRSYSRAVKILEGYLEAADGDGVIHPQIRTCGTATGRESCRSPNLQNVQKETTLKTRYPIKARWVFRPRPGYVNFHIDYAGIEARLLSHFSDDEKLIKLFTEGDGDLHTEFAKLTYGSKWEQASPERRKALRDAVKNGDFALGYGASWETFGQTVGISGQDLEEAKRRIEEAFPSYISMSRKFIEEVESRGYVMTAFGRRLYVSRDKPYVGTNYVVQGSAAGIIKRAQNRVYELLKRMTGNSWHILLPIHDELIIEAPTKDLPHAQDVLREVKRVMEDFPEFKVPLKVECEISYRAWSDTEEYKIQ